MVRHVAMVDHRITGFYLHTGDLGYVREAGEQPLSGQSGELFIAVKTNCFQEILASFSN